MPQEREGSSLNANAAEFVPFAVQQNGQSQHYIAQRPNLGQVPQSPTEPISGPYGHATGATAAAYASVRPATSEVQPAVPEIGGGPAGPMNAILGHSFTRDNHLHNPYVSNSPLDACPGAARPQVTGYNHHQNSPASSSIRNSLDAASARLLSIRYGFDLNDPSLGTFQLPTTGTGTAFLPRPLTRVNSYRSGAGSSTGMPFRKLNQYKAFNITKATGPRKLALEASTTSTASAQISSDDEENYGGGPDEAIWTKTSYRGPKMPQNYSLDDQTKCGENGRKTNLSYKVTSGTAHDKPIPNVDSLANLPLDEIPEDNPLPPPFPHHKRSLPPKSGIQGSVPLYGTLGGMQYDHSTKLYYGDGPPRSTPLRHDGTGPCMSDQSYNNHVCTISIDTRKFPSDVLHLQPMLEVRDNLLDFGINGIATMKFCRCLNMWGPESEMTEHVCTEPAIENRVQATPTSIKKAYSADRAPGRQPNSRHGARGLTQAEKNMRATNNVGIATGDGHGEKTGVEVRDFAESSSTDVAKRCLRG